MKTKQNRWIVRVLFVAILAVWWLLSVSYAADEQRTESPAKSDAAVIKRAKQLFFLEEYTEALKLLQSAADAGSPRAKFELAYAYWQGKGVPKDVDKAISILQELVAKDFTPAKLELAGFYEKGGNGVPKDRDRAIKLYKEAILDGYVDAYWYLAWVFIPSAREECRNRLVRDNYDEAKKWCRKGAEAGNPNCSSALGLLADWHGQVAMDCASDSQKQRVLIYVIREKYKWVLIAEKQMQAWKPEKRGGSELDPKGWSEHDKLMRNGIDEAKTICEKEIRDISSIPFPTRDADFINGSQIREDARKEADAFLASQTKP